MIALVVDMPLIFKRFSNTFFFFKSEIVRVKAFRTLNNENFPLPFETWSILTLYHRGLHDKNIYRKHPSQNDVFYRNQKWVAI